MEWIAKVTEKVVGFVLAHKSLLTKGGVIVLMGVGSAVLLGQLAGGEEKTDDEVDEESTTDIPPEQ